jgi:hypothetical protein
MGPLLWEHTKWVLFYGNIQNGFSSMGTFWEQKWVLFYGNMQNGFSFMGTYKMGSLLWEQTKWVIFYGNRQNKFSSMGTYKMGSLLWEHTKWVLFYGNTQNGFSPKGTDKVGFSQKCRLLCVWGKGGRMECQKKSLLGEKNNTQFYLHL